MGKAVNESILERVRTIGPSTDCWKTVPEATRIGEREVVSRRSVRSEDVSGPPGARKRKKEGREYETLGEERARDRRCRETAL
jgi:hypothetical protein